MTPLLSVKNLSIEFHHKKRFFTAVSDVNFSLYPSEILGIVGESGCGKSATIKALLRLHSEHQCKVKGEITYQDQDLLKISEKQMESIRGKKIGMIFQDPMSSLNPTLPIGKQVLEGYKKHYPMIPHKEAYQHMLDILTIVGIAPSRVNDYPYMLSGGMRQRIMIAISLICRPDILIADEPTTALDVTIQAQILQLIKTMQKKYKMSIVLITHDLSTIAGFCDRFLVMYGGKIVEIGSVDELFYQTKHPYTQQLIAATPRIDTPKENTLFSIEGTPPALGEHIVGCPFANRCPYAMKICTIEMPTSTTFSSTHQSYCWLHSKESLHVLSSH